MSESLLSCCLPSECARASTVTAEALPEPAMPASFAGVVRLDGGAFAMGSTGPETWLADGEGLVRQVSLRPFWIDQCAVTNREFAGFVNATGFVTEAERFGWSFVHHNQQGGFSLSLQMKTRLIFLAAVSSLWLAGVMTLRADLPLTPVTADKFYPLSRLADAQRAALTQGKPVGFLLTWPIYFPGAPDFHSNGSEDTTYFYQAFKDQAVLVNVNHATGELDRVPQVALDAFHSPAEGGYAPCLCLTNPTFTKLIGIIPLWKTPAERDQSFAHYRALIADKSHWWDVPTPANTTRTAAASVPDEVLAPRLGTSMGTLLAGLAREVESTRRAEQQPKNSLLSPRP